MSNCLVTALYNIALFFHKYIMAYYKAIIVVENVLVIAHHKYVINFFLYKSDLYRRNINLALVNLSTNVSNVFLRLVVNNTDLIVYYDSLNFSVSLHLIYNVNWFTVS